MFVQLPKTNQTLFYDGKTHVNVVVNLSKVGTITKSSETVSGLTYYKITFITGNNEIHWIFNNVDERNTAYNGVVITVPVIPKKEEFIPVYEKGLIKILTSYGTSAIQPSILKLGKNYSYKMRRDFIIKWMTDCDLFVYTIHKRVLKGKEIQTLDRAILGESSNEDLLISASHDPLNVIHQPETQDLVRFLSNLDTKNQDFVDYLKVKTS